MGERMDQDTLFQPLQFRNLKVKNRLFRSNISGRIDNYNGSGTPARIRFEEKFARGGVGAILSSHVPVTIEGRILPNYATIDRDARVGFWRELVDKVHESDCAFILQLSHSGHQQDIGGVENLKPGFVPWSSTNVPDFFHGIPSRAMTIAKIDETVQLFADGARRAKAAGCDGIELHASNGYLFTQFLSSAINDRSDEYGGDLENRARLLRRVVRAVRDQVGPAYHFQVKFSAVDHHDALEAWLPAGNKIDESIEVARWLEEDGVDALHVSTGSFFPHPRNPPGDFPTKEAARYYDIMLPNGSHTFRNYLGFRFLRSLTHDIWYRTTLSKDVPVEGVSIDDARRIKAAVKIPVISTGGYQRASLIRDGLASRAFDAVSIGRPLLANPDLPEMFRRGLDEAPRPCTFCNKCLLHVLEDPLGCYEESRYDSYDQMIEHVMSFLDEGGFELTESRDPAAGAGKPGPGGDPG
jgi:2,4-dienoyl-CoA reductase-like NADH-dependent reductase (Old Yellow Enzyme family)